MRRLKDAITQAQEEERENAERAIQTLVSDVINAVTSSVGVPRSASRRTQQQQADARDDVSSE